MQEIKITKTENSKLSELDFDNIPLGKIFTDHMFVCDFENGEWQNPRIEPMNTIATHPATMALHYGQAIFEGMKATLNGAGIPLLFRPNKMLLGLILVQEEWGCLNFQKTFLLRD